MSTTQDLDRDRRTLTWASNRLAEGHRALDLPEHEFQDILTGFLLATRAYHQSIRNINESNRRDYQRINSRTNKANHQPHPITQSNE
ncbi:hypothetical protein [Rothia sp. ZJ1223]|uniref:hypothetical protein n=1 Tax=Rothia sp. ZJ1223 TaxID=2811098 RepID=UPI00195B15DD|nr:hypothetical protein [Rothia sp. ZJ1223]MBM7052227.1 hypothetical protein [Rothia sp. ZJ1223]